MEVELTQRGVTIRLDRKRAGQLYWLVSGLTVAHVHDALQACMPVTIKGMSILHTKVPQRDVREAQALVRILRQGLRALRAGSPTPRARGRRPRAG